MSRSRSQNDQNDKMLALLRQISSKDFATMRASTKSKLLEWFAKRIDFGLCQTFSFVALILQSCTS